MRCCASRFGCFVAISLLGTATEAFAQSSVLLAQANAPVSESYASWAIRSLGLFGFLTLLTGGAIFVGACLVVFRARRPAVIASYLVFLLLPSMLAAIGVLKGTVASFAVLAATNVQLQPSELFAGLAESLLLPLCALMVTLPSFLVIAIGLFLRTLYANDEPTAPRRAAQPAFGKAAPA